LILDLSEAHTAAHARNGRKRQLSHHASQDPPPEIDLEETQPNRFAAEQGYAGGLVAGGQRGWLPVGAPVLALTAAYS
jgi:hypothetical protein